MSILQFQEKAGFGKYLGKKSGLAQFWFPKEGSCLGGREDVVGRRRSSCSKYSCRQKAWRSHFLCNGHTPG